MPRQLSIVEFVAMMGMLFATVAFSTDAMLPAFPAMAADLTPGNFNAIQLVIAAFIFGLGAGTFIAGPLSDSFGRKSVVVMGVLIFVVGCAISYSAQSLEMMLAGRVLQGLGAAGPRVGPLALMRDLYAGRKMAQLSSIIMAVFMLFPAVAPFIGQQILMVSSWHGIFVAFALFSVMGASWLMIRQPETLPKEKRRPLRFGVLLQGAKEVTTNRYVMLYTAALTLGFVQLLAIISSVQPVYEQTFGIVERFPLWFAFGALIAALGTIVNASLVIRLGMRRLAIVAFGLQIVLAASAATILKLDLLTGNAAFGVWFIWSTSTFVLAGLIFGNLNALALQPLGHIAGLAASLITGLSTVAAAILTIPIGLAFDGTPIPLMIGNLIAAILAFFLMRQTVNAPSDEAA